MKPRILIFDVYKTLLRVDPAPENAAALWNELWKDCFGEQQPPFDLREFGLRCRAVIECWHSKARAGGVDYPEIIWEEVVAEVLPPFAAAGPDVREHFVLGQTRTWHRVSLDIGCVPLLREARDRKMLLGIASNAQLYTVHELRTGLTEVSLDLSIFHPELRFWSFEQGFSKPSGGVFRLLTERAGSLGYGSSEIMMIGDRVDNDLEPARAAGWQVWHLRREGEEGPLQGGSWTALITHLF